MYRDSVIVLLHNAKLLPVQIYPKHSPIKTKPQPHWSKWWTIKIFWPISNKLLSFWNLKITLVDLEIQKSDISHIMNSSECDLLALCFWFTRNLLNEVKWVLLSYLALSFHSWGFILQNLCSYAIRELRLNSWIFQALLLRFPTQKPGGRRSRKNEREAGIDRNEGNC